MNNIFHAYDIRGVYGEELDEGIAYLIGRAIAVFTQAKEILLGKDMRVSSPSLREALVKGLTDQGANVVDIGLCSTPMFYWATQKYEAGVMVTASHNPSQYNGFKICKGGAVPVGGSNGLDEIEKLVLKNEFEQPEQKGTLREDDVLSDFAKFGASFLKSDRQFKVVVDAGNGMGGLTYGKLQEVLPKTVQIIPLYFELDGNFPNHDANPVKTETLRELSERVVKEGADFGLALDGDADRMGLVDEKGKPLPNDILLALLSHQVIEDHPGGKILFAVNMSRVVPQEVLASGGVPHMNKIGHAFFKLAMHDLGAIFGGEISGHFYNTEQQNTENTQIVFARLLNLLANRDQPLSSLVQELESRFVKIEETNFKVKDPRAVVAAIDAECQAHENLLEFDTHIDGLRADYEEWWFSLRASNTEPLLRLNLEAKTQELLDEKLKELSEKIKKEDIA